MISDRVKLIRKQNNLSQTEFGKKLGVSRDVICNIEYNRVEPKDLFLNHLCTIFNVNKNWILTGNGEIYTIPEEDVLLARALADISTNENKTLHQIVSKLTDLDEDYFNLILDLITALSSKDKK